MPVTAEIPDKVHEALKLALSVVQSLTDPNPAELAIHIYARAIEAERKIRAVLKTTDQGQ